MVGLSCVIVFTCFPVALISIGSVYNHSCTAIEVLPKQLIAIGVFIMATNIINAIDYFAGDRLWSKEKRSVVVVITNVIFNGLVVILFSLLCASMYGHPTPNHDNVGALDYCHPIPYIFAYWLTTSVIAFLWLLLIFSFILWCITTTEE